MGLDVWLVGAEARDGPGLLLVEGEDFDASGGGDGEGGVEEINAVALCRDVEFVVFAEEFGAATTGEQKPRPGGSGFLEDGFKNLLGVRNC